MEKAVEKFYANLKIVEPKAGKETVPLPGWYEIYAPWEFGGIPDNPLTPKQVIGLTIALKNAVREGNWGPLLTLAYHDPIDRPELRGVTRLSLSDLVEVTGVSLPHTISSRLADIAKDHPTFLTENGGRVAFTPLDSKGSPRYRQYYDPQALPGLALYLYIRGNRTDQVIDQVARQFGPQFQDAALLLRQFMTVQELAIADHHSTTGKVYLMLQRYYDFDYEVICPSVVTSKATALLLPEMVADVRKYISQHSRKPALPTPLGDGGGVHTGFEPDNHKDENSGGDAGSEGNNSPQVVEKPPQVVNKLVDYKALLRDALIVQKNVRAGGRPLSHNDLIDQLGISPSTAMKVLLLLRIAENERGEDRWGTSRRRRQAK